MGRSTEIKHSETFLGDIYVLYIYVYVLYLDSDDGYMSAGIYQNTFNCTLKCIHSIVCKLYLNKADSNKNNSLGTNKNANGYLGRDESF